MKLNKINILGYVFVAIGVLFALNSYISFIAFIFAILGMAFCYYPNSEARA